MPLADTHPNLTPRMAGLLDRIHRANRPPFHALSVDEARKTYLAAAEILEPPRAALPRVLDFAIPGGASQLPARLYAPSLEPGLPVVLYFHGGGFVIGGLETHDSLCRQIALRSGAAVVALDYRLAPEHRFPAAVDDAWTALAWISQNGADLSLDTTCLAVAGDSAGATLAAVAAIHARDIGLPLRAQVLITPGTIAHADTDSHRRYASGLLIDAETIAWFFDHYIDVAQRTDWRFAPLLADDVEGVAPAIVVLAESDPLFDEGIAYADKLRAAGVRVELDLHRGVTHDFIKMGRALPEAGAALDAIAATLRLAFESSKHMALPTS